MWCDDVGWTPKGKTGSVAETCVKGLWETIEENEIAGSKRAWFDNYLDVAGRYGYSRLPDEDTINSFVKFTKYRKNLNSAYADFTKRIHKACANRALLVTAKRYIGLAPWNARKGDIVTILLGGDTPYLLRPCISEPLYNLVGETYVHGLMEGEAMDPEASTTIQYIDIV